MDGLIHVQGKCNKMEQHFEKKSWLNTIVEMPFSIKIAVFWISLMIFVGLFANFITPYDYQEMDLLNRLKPPIWMEGGMWTHLFGTDDLGRDVLARLIESIRISLFVALAGTLIGATLGTLIGFAAAHFKGNVDHVAMILIDFQAAIPFLILALAALAFFGNSFLLFVIIMGIYGWEQYARIVRGLALSANTHGYAVAAKTLGASPIRLYYSHILPNIASAIIVLMTLNFPETILVETSLSFLGVGIQSPMTSLGNMVGFGRDYLLSAWWIALIPAILIFLTSLAFSLFGDWFRDKLDPTLKGT